MSKDVSEELLSIANTAYFQCRGNDVEKLRAAIDAVSDRLKAEGLREGYVRGMQAAIDRYVEGGLWNWETRTALEEMLAKARADALDPPKETK